MEAVSASCLLSMGVVIIIAASTSIDCFNAIDDIETDFEFDEKDKYSQTFKPIHIAILVIGIVQLLAALFMMYRVFAGTSSNANPTEVFNTVRKAL
jgi:hypothetical protein